MIVPRVVDHVTAVLLVPVTVAVNCCVAPVWIATRLGLTVTTMDGLVTLTVADADFVLSAAVVAFTV